MRKRFQSVVCKRRISSCYVFKKTYRNKRPLLRLCAGVTFNDTKCLFHVCDVTDVPIFRNTVRRSWFVSRATKTYVKPMNCAVFILKLTQFELKDNLQPNIVKPSTHLKIVSWCLIVLLQKSSVQGNTKRKHRNIVHVFWVLTLVAIASVAQIVWKSIKMITQTECHDRGLFNGSFAFKMPCCIVQLNIAYVFCSLSWSCAFEKVACLQFRVVGRCHQLNWRAYALPMIQINKNSVSTPFQWETRL